ncbi:MAG: GlxA family transcriptional regulator [Acidimicrobiales bacterium]
MSSTTRSLSSSHRPSRPRVVAVVIPGMSPLEISVASEFFGIDRKLQDRPWYRFSICTPEPGPVPLQGGMHLQVDHGLDRLRHADTIVIPGWCQRARRPDPDLLAALQAADRRGARMVSFCTGAFALAAAGVLDGRRATTHWDAADDFRRLHPSIELDPGVLYVRDDHVWTSAGSAASIDCALAIVREDYGAEVANEVARDLVVPPHRDGGQAQFVAAPLASHDDGASLAASLDWAIERLDQPLTVADLAEHAHLSPRQFSRRFRQITGTTPHQWLLAQRILLARRLLETTDLSIDRVADEAGFGSPAALRMHFQRSVHTSPLAYRRVFSRAAS